MVDSLIGAIVLSVFVCWLAVASYNVAKEKVMRCYNMELSYEQCFEINGWEMNNEQT